MTNLAKATLTDAQGNLLTEFTVTDQEQVTVVHNPPAGGALLTLELLRPSQVSVTSLPPVAAPGPILHPVVELATAYSVRIASTMQPGESREFTYVQAEGTGTEFLLQAGEDSLWEMRITSPSTPEVVMTELGAGLHRRGIAAPSGTEYRVTVTLLAGRADVAALSTTLATLPYSPAAMPK